MYVSFAYAGGRSVHAGICCIMYAASVCIACVLASMVARYAVWGIGVGAYPLVLQLQGLLGGLLARLAVPGSRLAVCCTGVWGDRLRVTNNKQTKSP